MTDRDSSTRRPWTEDGDEDAPPESWLSLDDDALLHRIETLDPRGDDDDPLVEVVASDRHFFIRQEAAKRVKDRRRLYAFEDDRHVGQIFVRHLSRREDLTYLERIAMMGRHVEVRQAAQVQLARVWRRLEPSHGRDAPPSPDVAAPPAASSAGSRPAVAHAPLPVQAAAVAVATAAPSTPLEGDEVDGSLLGWAVHFLVERAWKHLGTKATVDLLLRSRRELIATHPALRLFAVGKDARVTVDLVAGPRVSRTAVRDVAMWMAVFRKAAAKAAPAATADSARASTALMADALHSVGFYGAFEDAEAALAL
ncbi:MAG TPA: hypothetical protein VMT70_18260 [Vicinamibacteria bacterium]|nr:hypothetical protein [Vicinamibacteria bacterium]